MGRGGAVTPIPSPWAPRPGRGGAPGWARLPPPPSLEKWPWLEFGSPGIEWEGRAEGRTMCRYRGRGLPWLAVAAAGAQGTSPVASRRRTPSRPAGVAAGMRQALCPRAAAWPWPGRAVLQPALPPRQPAELGFTVDRIARAAVAVSESFITQVVMLARLLGSPLSRCPPPGRSSSPSQSERPRHTPTLAAPRAGPCAAGAWRQGLALVRLRTKWSKC